MPSRFNLQSDQFEYGYSLSVVIVVIIVLILTFIVFNAVYVVFKVDEVGHLSSIIAVNSVIGLILLGVTVGLLFWLKKKVRDNDRNKSMLQNLAQS